MLVWLCWFDGGHGAMSCAGVKGQSPFLFQKEGRNYHESRSYVTYYLGCCNVLQIGL